MPITPAASFISAVSSTPALSPTIAASSTGAPVSACGLQMQTHTTLWGRSKTIINDGSITKDINLISSSVRLFTFRYTIRQIYGTCVSPTSCIAYSCCIFHASITTNNSSINQQLQRLQAHIQIHKQIKLWFIGIEGWTHTKAEDWSPAHVTSSTDYGRQKVYTYFK
ncbi:uncharacterized protein LOC128219724 isoform X2 [Mya arenaria]|uniref:uncharacterized protein LOC128219724 isoform X2 n=1 Tax=Mya arenaria TaxID=6604 RepID=UPI0022E4E579|nr:uncharacterized protein LOC128219724 isoform X2 [Mya arenaria]